MYDLFVILKTRGKNFDGSDVDHELRRLGITIELPANGLIKELSTWKIHVLKKYYQMAFATLLNSRQNGYYNE